MLIENIKAKIARFPSQEIMFTLEEVLPLITTIESQKEEMEKLAKDKQFYNFKSIELAIERDKYWQDAKNERELGESIVAEREKLYTEVESLKAITELAVKELQFYADEENYDLEQEEHYIKVTLDRGDKARTALTEIARLKNAQT